MFSLISIVFLQTIAAAFVCFAINILVKSITDISKKAEHAKVNTPTLSHPTEISLQNLIEVDGAGSWPPKTSYGQDWPEALRPFHDIYLELVPSLSTADLSSDDHANYKRCLDYRIRYRQMLAERVDLKQVHALLSAAENGTSNILPREAWNGLFACIALSRHAFR